MNPFSTSFGLPRSLSTNSTSEDDIIMQEIITNEHFARTAEFDDRIYRAFEVQQERAPTKYDCTFQEQMISPIEYTALLKYNKNERQRNMIVTRTRSHLSFPRQRYNEPVSSNYLLSHVNMRIIKDYHTTLPLSSHIVNLPSESW